MHKGSTLGAGAAALLALSTGAEAAPAGDAVAPAVRAGRALSAPVAAAPTAGDAVLTCELGDGSAACSQPRPQCRACALLRRLRGGDAPAAAGADF